MRATFLRFRIEIVNVENVVPPVLIAGAFQRRFGGGKGTGRQIQRDYHGEAHEDGDGRCQPKITMQIHAQHLCSGQEENASPCICLH